MKRRKGNRVAEFKEGSVIVTLWENEAKYDGAECMFPNITISRAYFSESTKSFAWTSSLRGRDLVDAGKALNKCLERVTEIYGEQGYRN